MKRLLSRFAPAALLVCAVAIGASWGAAKASWRKMPQQAFAVGEELEFSLGWEAAKAGSAAMKVQEMTTRRNRRAYHVVLEASSNRAIDTVFQVRDRYDSWIDAEALCSLGMAKRMRQGKNMKDETVLINPLTGAYERRWVRPHKGPKVTTEKGTTAPFAQDIISASYYLRAQPLKVGQTVVMDVLNNSDTTRAEVAVLREETVQTSAGLFACFVLETRINQKKTDDSSAQKIPVLVWVTKDNRHMPVKIALALPVGEISAELVRYKRPS